MTMTNKEKSSRTCLITSGILILPGLAIMSPEGGVMVLLLSLIFAIAGLCMGYSEEKVVCENVRGTIH